MTMIFIHLKYSVVVLLSAADKGDVYKKDKKQEYLALVCKSKQALLNFSPFFKELVFV